jgi:hypothetical protein
MDANESRLYGASVMSDEERIAILADIILDAISAEDAQGAETEG